MIRCFRGRVLDGRIKPPGSETLPGGFILKTQESDVPRTAGANSSDPTASIIKAESVISELGEGCRSHKEKIRGLLDRLSEGRFHLAVLGQFKRGKSTLLNALLGESLLPTAVIPLTAIPTFVRFANERSARVSFSTERAPEEFRGNGPGDINAFLAGYVSEEANPGNRLEVSLVEVTAPCAFLEKGVVLIDTPGIGSTHRHNTEATLNFLPQCDAALFLVSADPPITEVEVEFLKEVGSKVKRLFFILNKIDYLSDDDRDSVIRFCRKIIMDKAGLGEEMRMFPVSARQGLQAAADSDEELWMKSGMKAVDEHLISFLAGEKTRVLREAIAQKAADVLTETVMRLHLEVRSLEMPLAELENRLGVFEKSIVDAERQRLFAGDILAGERKRLMEFLEEQAEILRKRSHAYLEGIAAENLSNTMGELNENRVREAIAGAIPVFFERELGEMSRTFDRRVSESLLAHRQKADELIEAVRKAAAEIFDIPYHPGGTAGGLEMSQEPYWVTHRWHSSLVPIPDEWVDRIMPYRTRLKRIRRRINHQINDLVMFNVENLRWATLQNLDTTFRRFASELDSRLGDTVDATRGAIVAAMERRGKERAMIDGELRRLNLAIGAVEDVIKQLPRGA
jgi:GTPase Era involved in 16S rRNA processing